MEIITLDDVLKIMYQLDDNGDPVPFSIKAATCDLNRGSGGEHLIYDKAVICNPLPDKKVFTNRNDARNIKGYGTNQIRAVHPLLIIEINGKKVAI